MLKPGPSAAEKGIDLPELDITLVDKPQDSVDDQPAKEVVDTPVPPVVPGEPGEVQEIRQEVEVTERQMREKQLRDLIQQFASMTSSGGNGSAEAPDSGTFDQYKPKTEDERKAEFAKEQKKRLKTSAILTGAIALGGTIATASFATGGLALIAGGVGYLGTLAVRKGIEWYKNRKSSGKFAKSVTGVDGAGEEGKSWNEQENEINERIYQGEKARLEAVCKTATEAWQLIQKQEAGQEADPIALESKKAEFLQKLIEYRTKETELSSDKQKLLDMTKKSGRWTTALSVGAGLVIAGTGVNEILKEGVHVAAQHGLGEITKHVPGLPHVAERLLSTDLWHAMTEKVFFHYTQGAGGEHEILQAAVAAAEKAGHHIPNFLHDDTAKQLFIKSMHEGDNQLTKLFWQELIKQKGLKYLFPALAFVATSVVAGWGKKGQKTPESQINATALGIDEETLATIKREVDQNKSALETEAENQAQVEQERLTAERREAAFEKNPEMKELWDQFHEKKIIGRTGAFENNIYELTGISEDLDHFEVTGEVEGENKIIPLTPDQFDKVFLDENGKAKFPEPEEGKVIDTSKAEYGTAENPYHVANPEENGFDLYIRDSEEAEDGKVILYPVSEDGTVSKDHPLVITPEDLATRLVPEKDEGGEDEERTPTVEAPPEEKWRSLDSIQTASGEVKPGYDFIYISEGLAPERYKFVVNGIQTSGGETEDANDLIRIDFSIKMPDGSDHEVGDTWSRSELAEIDFRGDNSYYVKEHLVEQAVEQAKKASAPETPAEEETGKQENGTPEAEQDKAEKAKIEQLEAKAEALNQRIKVDDIVRVRVQDGKLVFLDPQFSDINDLGVRVDLDNLPQKVDFDARGMVFDADSKEIRSHFLTEKLTEPGLKYIESFHSYDSSTYDRFRDKVTKVGEGAPPFGTGKFSVRFDDGKLYELTNVTKTTDDYSYTFEHNGLLASKVMNTSRIHLLSSAVDWYIREESAPTPPHTPAEGAEEKGGEDEVGALPPADEETKTPDASPIIPPAKEEKTPESEAAGDGKEPPPPETPEIEEQKLERQLAEITEKTKGQIFDFEGDQGRETITVDGEPLINVLAKISQESGHEVKNWWFAQDPQFKGKAHIDRINLYEPFDGAGPNEKKISVSYRFSEIQKDPRLADGYERGGYLEDCDAPDTSETMLKHGGEIVIRDIHDRLYLLDSNPKGLFLIGPSGQRLNDHLEPIGESEAIYTAVEWYYKKEGGEDAEATPPEAGAEAEAIPDVEPRGPVLKYPEGEIELKYGPNEQATYISKGKTEKEKFKIIQFSPRPDGKILVGLRRVNYPKDQESETAEMTLEELRTLLNNPENFSKGRE